jgi:uncharacterized membrane protein YedE/YeeE
MIALVVSCLFAAILGFSAHRASVCTVRAVAELSSSRTGHMLLSIAKSSVWVLAVTLPFFWLMPSAGAGLNGWRLTEVAVLGGFVFGIGAGINGACAYSTMARIVDGEARMLLAVGGFAGGVLVYAALLNRQWLTRPTPTPALVGTLADWALVAAIALLVWAGYEVARLWHTRPLGVSPLQMMWAPQYRLSTAAMVIGLAGSAIFLIYGSPGYTITLQNLIESAIGMRSPPARERWILLLAVLVGMALSTAQRGSFRFDWRPRWSWLRNIFGGAVMGLGTALLPGGNDALVLYGIPALSPHALPAFAAMLVGIAAALWLLRWFGVEMRVACRNDLYFAEGKS